MPRTVRSTSGLNRAWRELLGGERLTKPDQLDQVQQLLRRLPKPEFAAVPANHERQPRERVNCGGIRLQAADLDGDSGHRLHGVWFCERRRPRAKIIGRA